MHATHSNWLEFMRSSSWHDLGIIENTCTSSHRNAAEKKTTDSLLLHGTGGEAKASEPSTKKKQRHTQKAVFQMIKYECEFLMRFTSSFLHALALPLSHACKLCLFFIIIIIIFSMLISFRPHSRHHSMLVVAVYVDFYYGTLRINCCLSSSSSSSFIP